MQRIEQLQLLKNEVAQCTKCQELAQYRTQTVCGVGNPEADIVFIGEAPAPMKTIRENPSSVEPDNY